MVIRRGKTRNFKKEKKEEVTAGFEVAQDVVFPPPPEMVLTLIEWL